MVRALAQATAQPMLMDMSDGYKCVGQKGLVAMLYMNTSRELHKVYEIIIIFADSHLNPRKDY